MQNIREDWELGFVVYKQGKRNIYKSVNCGKLIIDLPDLETRNETKIKLRYESKKLVNGIKEASRNIK